MPASYPGSVKSFTTKVDGVDDIQAAHVNDLQLEVNALETEFLANMTDYSSLSTVTGWSGTPSTLKIFSYKVGRMVSVYFAISGTSLTTGVSFTVPVTAANPTNAPSPQVICRGQDNGGAFAVCLATLTPGTNVVNVYNGLSASATWTASGTKGVFGQLFYIAA